MFQEILKGLSNMGGQEAVAVPAGYEDPVAKMNTLEKFGLGLGGIDAVNSYRNSAMKVQDRQLEAKRLDALRQLGEKVQRGEMTREQAQLEYGNITGDFSSVFGVGAQAPAALREWNAYNQMSPEEQRRYLQMKRANQMFDRGGSQVVLDPQGGVVTEIDKTLPPEKQPENIAEQKAAEVTGKGQGEAEAKLKSMQANMPNLEALVKDLSVLGQKATYTKAGQLKDEAMRQSGLEPGEGAVARTEYMAKVNNEILPLLKQTFGAQFTVAEGEELRKTLGDPDKSPTEKDAVLKAFIESKRSEIESLQREIGKGGTTSGSAGGVKEFTYNPETGQLE